MLINMKHTFGGNSVISFNIVKMKAMNLLKSNKVSIFFPFILANNNKGHFKIAKIRSLNLSKLLNNFALKYNKVH